MSPVGIISGWGNPDFMQRRIDEEDLKIASARTFNCLDTQESWSVSVDAVCNDYEPSGGVEGEPVDNEFDLMINTYYADTRSEQLRALYHELRHIRQYIEGGSPFVGYESQDDYNESEYEIEASQAEVKAFDHDLWREEEYDD